MPAIEAFVLDGRVTLLALFILALELILVAAFHRRLSRLTLLANGLSGMSLIMALRAGLIGPDPASVAFWLGLGFVAHLVDLASRLRRRDVERRPVPEPIPENESATGRRPPPAGHSRLR